MLYKKNISPKHKWWVHDPDRRVTRISEYALWKKRWISNTNYESRTHLDRLQIFLRIPCKNVVNLKHKLRVQDSPRQVTNISENAL